jgi:hypothetical protein
VNLDELSPELIEGIDKYIEAADEPPNPRLTRNEAVIIIVRDWLMAQGYIPLPPPKEDAG